jgi:hypothetical protein
MEEVKFAFETSQAAFGGSKRGEIVLKYFHEAFKSAAHFPMRVLSQDWQPAAKNSRPG